MRTILILITTLLLFVGCNNDSKPKITKTKPKTTKSVKKAASKNDIYWANLKNHLKVSKEKIAKLRKETAKINQEKIKLRKAKKLDGPSKRRLNAQLNKACQTILGKSGCANKKNYDKKLAAQKNSKKKGSQ